jgi:hypothetical protein
MKIKIAHLGYTILVKDISKGNEEHKAWCERDNTNQATIFLDLKETNKKYYFPTIAHEVTHILQFIAGDRTINFPLELEHFGYLMNYICNEILGIEYDV